MTQTIRCVPPSSIIAGWDFSTGTVKCVAFDVDGNTVTQVRLPTDLWTASGVSELNLMQLEGQARASARAIAAQLRDKGRLQDWIAGGISATHHTAGRIDRDYNQVRRAICWNDHSLAEYHARGLKRIGGQEHVVKLTGGPWANRYTLSQLVKDEENLSLDDWRRTYRIVQHGALAAGYLTGNFDVVSVSSAASTGIMNLRTGKWCKPMLKALEDPKLRNLAWKQLPRIQDMNEPVGPLVSELAKDIGLCGSPPLFFPSSDDQQAGLVGGGAVDAGQVAVILGNSAVVNSSSTRLPTSSTLDAMRLSWGPYLWMRCYNNGAQFLDRVVGTNPDWAALEAEARVVPAGCDGIGVLPFVYPEPSLKVSAPCFRWSPSEPRRKGMRYRAALESLAYLIAMGVREHTAAGQQISRISVSGGIARSDLMCEILATMLGRPLERLTSDEGPALGAAAVALAGLETHLRRKRGILGVHTVADAVPCMVRFRKPVTPCGEWRDAYKSGFREFRRRLKNLP